MEDSISTLLGLNPNVSLCPQQEPMCMLGSFAGTGIQRPGGEKRASRTTSVHTSLQAKGCRSCFSNSRLCQAPPCVPSMHLCVKLGNQLSRTFPGDGGPLLAWTTPCWKSLEYTVPEFQTKFRGHGRGGVALDFSGLSQSPLQCMFW